MIGSSKNIAKENKIKLPSASTRQANLFVDGFYSRLNQSKVFSLILPLLIAGLTGLLVSPEVTLREYPSGELLLGSPATTDIKAPYDIEVQNEVKTEQKRNEVIRNVPRVYDHDIDSV